MDAGKPLIAGGIIKGQRYRWSLVKKLGEGDAGEVYRVESLLEQKPGILKRPHRSSFTTDVLRQAAQIKTEGRILRALEGIALPGGDLAVRTPALIDQSEPGSEFGDQYFVVIEEAPGMDLATMSRLARFGKAEEEQQEPRSPEEQIFIQHLIERGSIPELVLLRALLGLVTLFEKVHFTEITREGVRQAGVIWNDVKPEHVYWDPGRRVLTIIDWGNGQFLEADGATKDRHYSRIDDYVQFLQEMGRFVADCSPELFERLDWPAEISPGNAYSEGVKPLKERTAALFEQEMERLREARRREADLAWSSAPHPDLLKDLADIHQQIFDFGEVPDYSAAERLYAQAAAKVVSTADGVEETGLAERLELFRKICDRAGSLPSADSEMQAVKWKLLADCADLGGEFFDLTAGTPLDERQKRFLQALHAGVAEDWPSLLWRAMSLVGEGPLPAWWEEISQRVRKIHLQLDDDVMTPYVVVSRLFFTLQSNLFRAGGLPDGNGGQNPEMIEALVRMLEEEVIKKWKEVEPAPPNAGIEYRDIDGLIDDIERVLPGSQQSLDKALGQARAQVGLVMDAWARKEFETARRGLRTLLLWDPHRRRLLLADRALVSASQWLLRVRQGAGKDEPLHDYLTQVELAGRDLRNQVGPAGWLDLILNSLKQLRNGARPADLIMEHPELLTEIPWLNEYRSRETINLPRTRKLTLERDPVSIAELPGLHGVREGVLGPEGDLALGEPLDTWAPEARGSSARVFSGRLQGIPEQPGAAIKIMRPDEAEYAAPLFREEAQILTLMRDVPGVMRMYELGFLRLDEGHALPPEDRQHSGAGLRGKIQRYGVEELQNFLISMDVRIGQGWLPYLAFERYPQQHNLMVYCDAGHTHGRFLPLRESLFLAIQICDILQVAHDRNIVYRDHKILHYYWDANRQGVVMIDWNIARRHPQGLSSGEKQFDLVQFGARALHHIMTGRSAPGALPLGPNRPEEIEQASHQYRVQWTYDDERLPNRLKEIIEKTLTEGYSQVRELRQDLYEIYQQLPDSE